MSSEISENVLAFGPFLLDAKRLLLFRSGVPVPIGPKVVQTLLALVEQSGRICTKAELLDRVWPEGFVSEGNLSQNVHVLRKTLRSWNPNAIETLPRRGYRFTVSLAQHVPAATAPPAFRRRRSRVFAALGALALGAAAAGALALVPQTRLKMSGSANLNARQLYAIGHYYWDMRTRSGIEKSAWYFARAVDADPGDARNLAALASTDELMANYQYGSLPPATYYARARTYAHEALEIDPHNSDAYADLGAIATATSWPGTPYFTKGLAELQHAIVLDPHSARARLWYGIALLTAAPARDALRELKRAYTMDPLSVAAAAWASQAAFQAGDFNDAIAYAHDTLTLTHDRNEVLEPLGLAYEQRGDSVRAIAEFKRMAAMREPYLHAEGEALLAYAYARSDRAAQARRALAFAVAHRSDVTPQSLAAALDANGNSAAAIAVLRAATRMHECTAMSCDPRIADDPRLQGLRNAAAALRRVE